LAISDALGLLGSLVSPASITNFAGQAELAISGELGCKPANTQHIHLARSVPAESSTRSGPLSHCPLGECDPTRAAADAKDNIMTRNNAPGQRPRTMAAVVLVAAAATVAGLVGAVAPANAGP
jgi:hypothetical protein